MSAAAGGTGGAPALSLSFFDPDRKLAGELRTGVTILYEGPSPTALAEGCKIHREEDGSFAALMEAGDAELALRFGPMGDPAELAGARTWVCRVKGQVAGAPIDCLGTATETLEPPNWEELEAVRSITAVFDPGHALFCVARRDRGTRAHGEEAVEAVLITAGVVHTAEDARISTVYDGDGRQRQVGLELWFEEEDFPRRAFGRVSAGTSLELSGATVHASVFDWRMEGREGAGTYDLMVRAGPGEAA
ncbi:MAG: hypothetical protein H0T15_02085 [Thermoleophilaceae bacterium]|nr:hypothetical protein [Thermoleophilaceae bacterium]